MTRRPWTEEELNVVKFFSRRIRKGRTTYYAALKAMLKESYEPWLKGRSWESIRAQLKRQVKRV